MMHTSKPKLTEELKTKVFDNLIKNNRDLGSYQEIIKNYELNNNQINELIKIADFGVSGAYEAKIVEEITRYLNLQKQ